jgi:hypothetical protein
LKQPKPPNPHCPIAGCEIKAPHLDDPLIKSLKHLYDSADKLLGWTLTAMNELRASVLQDIENQRLFSWVSRIRQSEEIYYRMLYLLFIATDVEIPHILSGKPPNSLYSVYQKVNTQILEGRGELTVTKEGLNYGGFTVMNTMNSGAHADFPTLFMVASAAKHPEYMPDPALYVRHLTTYCDRLNYMRQMFEGGKTKEDVKQGVISMHRPASYWEDQARKARKLASKS